MSTNQKKFDTLETGVYTIRNDMLKTYEPCFSCKAQNIADYLSIIVNDVTSKFYGTEQNFSLYRIGTFNEETGEIIYKDNELITKLDMFIDNKKRNLQIICQTLNYLPTGYFKMPEEMKKEIQEKIDKATTKYIEEYVIKDIDVNGIKTDKIENSLTN